jgi:hypothetical protein
MRLEQTMGLCCRTTAVFLSSCLAAGCSKSIATHWDVIAAGDPLATSLVEVCVLGEQGPGGTCASESVVDFGFLPNDTTRDELVRLTVGGDEAIELSAIGFEPDTDDLSVMAVAEDADAGATGGWRSTRVLLPTRRAPGEHLYVQLTAAARRVAGPLEATALRIGITAADLSAGVVEVPLRGVRSGCAYGLGSCDAEASQPCSTDVLSSLVHCGACDATCALPHAAAACVDGRCHVGSCETGFADCAGGESDGCEAELAVDPQNCSACGHLCPSFVNGLPACAGGVCGFGGCVAGWADCNASLADGCELDVASDPLNCGACAHPCVLPHAVAACSAGLCTVGACDDGYGDCDGDAADGCETDLTVAAHCGSCDEVCVSAHGDSACTAGSCVVGTCDAGYGDCNHSGRDGCEQRLNTNRYCGSCTNNCANAIANANAQCAGSTCQFTSCKTGWVDLNQDTLQTPTDGCEHACTALSAQDDPDDGFVDDNCDGIDGEVNHAIFLAPGGDDAWPGTRTQPKGTLAGAIAAAASASKDVYAAGGVYDFATTIELAPGVSIYGGYSYPSWTRSDAASGIAQFVSTSTTIALHASGVDNAVLDRVSFSAFAASNSGESSYGLFATSSSLSLRYSTFVAGAGAGGRNGSTPPGTIAKPGQAGGGNNGCEFEDQYGCGNCSSPTVGAGGTNTCAGAVTNPAGGNGGAPGRSANAGSPGDASAAGTSGGAAETAGGNGRTGNTGSAGSAGRIDLDETGAVPVGGGPGGTGDVGWGGGGGGGGRGKKQNPCDTYGGSGGGGGAGGCGGAGGSGGTSGGSSVAVYAFSSSIATTACLLTVTTGGRGGNGAAGQGGGPGGDPGSGGSGSEGSYGGAAGGQGGQGGQGGSGGGGAGGHSIGLLVKGGSLTIDALTQNAAVLGVAGSGGSSLGGNAGPTGQAVAVLNVP